MVQLRLHSRPSVPTTSSAYPSTNGFTPASALCNIAAAARRTVTMLLALASIQAQLLSAPGLPESVPLVVYGELKTPGAGLDVKWLPRRVGSPQSADR